jgi:hypothetical protein
MSVVSSDAFVRCFTPCRLCVLALLQSAKLIGTPYTAAYEFYSSHTRHVEVMANGKLQRVDFPLPVIAFHLPDDQKRVYVPDDLQFVYLLMNIRLL